MLGDWKKRRYHKKQIRHIEKNMSESARYTDEEHWDRYMRAIEYHQKELKKLDHKQK